ncbi:hypothetical protein AHiyo1_37160 [Arthrobacter sp. Hiyo1]|nr:hypothetical protein AHiyo1_37160 [Arthrobacter sp. Hiyo1]
MSPLRTSTWSGALVRGGFREGVVEGHRPVRVVEIVGFRVRVGPWVRGREGVPVRERIRGQFRFLKCGRVQVREGVRFLAGREVVWPVGWFPVLVFAGVVPV